jgi:RimJ/RimL family protein N-acetyltransferase
MERPVHIRRATEDDAAGIAAVMERIAAERIHSAIDRAWTAAEERDYLRGLSAREAVHVAAVDSGQIIGVQSLDLWAASLNSMRHVGQVGTFLLPEYRRIGLGAALFRATAAFARASGYRKFVIQVRGSNTAARAFYSRLGFRACGLLARQVWIDGREDDEVLMELFLE